MIPNAALIRKAREYFNLTQLDLASMAKVSLPTISNLESGKLTNPTLGTLNAIAGVFHIDPRDLLTSSTKEFANDAVGKQLRTLTEEV